MYNLRIANWHTYFVGDAREGWSVWAHNAEYALKPHPDGGYALAEKQADGSFHWVTDPNDPGKVRRFADEADAKAAVASKGGSIVQGNTPEPTIAPWEKKRLAAPNPHARPMEVHVGADEIAENFNLGLLEKHGDPGKWEHQFTKSVPLTQMGARPGERKFYEVWKDEFGRKFEWHYEVDELGRRSVGKYVYPSTTPKPR